MEWHTHYPDRAGIYRCRVNHERETYLVCHQCVINHRYRWQLINGQDVNTNKHYIEWTGEATTIMDVEPEDVAWFDGK